MEKAFYKMKRRRGLLMSAKHMHRTAVFTIHNPTRHVRAVLDKAFTLYTNAYTAILHHFSSYAVEELQAMATYALDDNGQPRTGTKRLVQALFSHEIPAITAALFPLEGSMRESLKESVAETLLSYVELALHSNQVPSYPVRLRKQDQEPVRLEALEGLRLLADNQEHEDILLAQLARTKQAEAVSITLIRIDTGRNCGLFYNPDTHKFYARLYVVSPRSHLAKPLTMAGRYIDVRSGKIYARREEADPKQGIESFGSDKGSILVPLEMGAWHEQPLRFIEQAFLPQRIGEETKLEPVAARLVRREKTYQLHVSFRIPKPKRLKPCTLLGIDRGITCLAAGAVVSLDTKQVIETYMADGKELGALLRRREHLTRLKQQKGKITKGDRQRTHIADQHVHICANQIVALAIKHQAQVIMEDLHAFAAPHKRPKGQRRSNFNKMLPRRQYQKVQDLVNAKLALVGLPPIRTVSAAFTSITCTCCGHISTDNRSAEDRTQFVCVKCGYKDHADVQAGTNIARRLSWITLRSQEKKVGIEERDRTTWATFVQRLML